MTIDERIDRLTTATERLHALAAENERRWSEERQAWTSLRRALAVGLNDWLKSQPPIEWHNLEGEQQQ